MQTWRLQQETLRLSRAGESRPQLIAVFLLWRDWLAPVPSSPRCYFFSLSLGTDGEEGGC